MRYLVVTRRDRSDTFGTWTVEPRDAGVEALAPHMWVFGSQRGAPA
jgi:hypothetical protein